MEASRVLLPVAFVALGVATLTGQQSDGQRFRFRTGVELVNVTVTVTDRDGRFVPGLRREDFRVFDDGQEQQVTHFNSERVPVSLGIALDTSGSMAGEKMEAARAALNRFLYDLLDQEDEIFLYRFDTYPQLVEGWTTDRMRLRDQLRRIYPRGNTALYDTVADAVPLAQSGSHRKKALLVISDGNDTSSQTSVPELRKLIRETEVLVYAIGIDGTSPQMTGGTRPPVAFPPPRGPRGPFPIPFPFPGRRPPSSPPQPPVGVPRGGTYGGPNDRVNAGALRALTDDSGGRTEIIRSARDLEPATASIADELSKQYYLGYPAPSQKDGRWHTIRVEVRNRGYIVRARQGYFAGPVDPGAASQQHDRQDAGRDEKQLP